MTDFSATLTAVTLCILGTVSVHDSHAVTMISYAGGQGQVYYGLSASYECIPSLCYLLVIL